MAPSGMKAKSEEAVEGRSDSSPLAACLNVLFCPQGHARPASQRQAHPATRGILINHQTFRFLIVWLMEVWSHSTLLIFFLTSLSALLSSTIPPNPLPTTPRHT